ncbi:MAG: family 10 glycosylhydrolase [Limisphaerales bacterium]
MVKITEVMDSLFVRVSIAGVCAFCFFARSSAAQDAEYRFFWASAYQDGFKNAAQVSRMVAEIRAVHCNGIIVEVRKRGDAYYNSTIEPRATDIEPGFDPLAEMIKQAHDTNSGPRLDVHAWVVAYPVWGEQWARPTMANHPYLLHPDWLTRDLQGAKWYAEYYSFDPGHPAVQKYLFDVCMEIVSRYDVDGLQLDHIRYDRNTWGYNRTTVARFNERFHRSGQPPPLDADWLQFRRDQVTDLVRKIYICATEVRPRIKITVAANTRAPGISQLSEWPKAAPYSMLMQDWRAWMEEGIIDIAIDLAYFRQQQWASAWDKWNLYAKDNKYQRHSIYSPGPFINSVPDSLHQIHTTRTPTAKGNRSDGVALYCYAITSNDGVPREAFLKALTTPSRWDADPVFARPVPIPEMPWKSKPVKGMVKGLATDATSSNAVVFADVALAGPVRRYLRSDATGFFGAIELPPGEYSASVVSPRYRSATNSLVVKAGVVASCVFRLEEEAKP